MRLGLEGRPRLSQNEKILPNSLILHLADVERGNERHVYQIMTFLADFGGFNDGILLLPALLMSIYNSKMFYQVIATLLPVKHRHQSRTSTNSNQTEQRFAKKESLG